jgi:5-hydroxyisourate hydrolase-like protein (transthyretin family)
MIDKEPQKTIIEGEYNSFKTDEFENCNLKINITNHRGNYTYHLISYSKNIKGRLKLSFSKNDYFAALVGTKISESGKLVKENDPIRIQIQNDTITIQNYGNSMNYYVQLNDCSEKFIKLAKTKN